MAMTPEEEQAHKEKVQELDKWAGAAVTELTERFRAKSQELGMTTEATASLLSWALILWSSKIGVEFGFPEKEALALMTQMYGVFQAGKKK